MKSVILLYKEKTMVMASQLSGELGEYMFIKGEKI
jgi:hypothetical protein